MRMFPCNRQPCGRMRMIAVLALLMLIPWQSALAQENSIRSENSASRISIQADKLIAYNETRMFELIGNVKAIRGEMVIQADHLKVYPQAASQPQSHLSAFKNKVNRVVATGNVHITYGKFVATADQAVYSAQKETIALTGNPTKVSQENQSMTAKQMTLFIEDERVRVSGQGKQRVKAVFRK